MENFIHDYLSENYYITTSKVGNDGIYIKNDDRPFIIPISGAKLLETLSVIFSMPREGLITQINLWSKNQKSTINLDFYWKNHYVENSGILQLINDYRSSISIPLDEFSVTQPSPPQTIVININDIQESYIEKIIHHFSNIYYWIFGKSNK